MRGSRGATGAVAPSAKPRSRARRLCALACALAVLVTVSLGSDRSANPRAPSDRGDASSSRAPNLDAVTGGGTGVSPALGTKPAVAVYFTGQARTLRRTLCSVRRHIFDPLVAQGFAPVVFVAGERDGDAEAYASLLGRIPGVEIGDVRIVDRPGVVKAAGEAAKYEDLPSPAADASLPAPRACAEAFKRKGRWFHAGGDGSDARSKNARYSEEVLSQLWYRNVVDRMRVRWEETERGRRAGAFQWIVAPGRTTPTWTTCPTCAPRAPTCRETSSAIWPRTTGLAARLGADAGEAAGDRRGHRFRAQLGRGVSTPHAGGGGWGPSSSSHGIPRAQGKRRRLGVNNRFSYGGVAAMSAYHDLYARMCHDGLAQSMAIPPASTSSRWCVGTSTSRRSSRRACAARFPSRGNFGPRAAIRGDGATPVENPGHEPAMVDARWGRTGAGLRNARPGAPGAEIVDDKPLWRRRKEEGGDYARTKAARRRRSAATARGECRCARCGRARKLVQRGSGRACLSGGVCGGWPCPRGGWGGPYEGGAGDFLCNNKRERVSFSRACRAHRLGGFGASPPDTGSARVSERGARASATMSAAKGLYGGGKDLASQVRLGTRFPDVFASTSPND